jgi:hypothetical protein
MIGFVGFLTRRIVALTNRQRTLILRYYPAAAELFSALNIPIAQHFIRTFSSPQEAARLDLEQFQAFARQHHYTQYRKLPAILAKPYQPYPQADRPAIEVIKPILVQIIAQRESLDPQKMKVRTFFYAVARVGGFPARRSDGEPGWKRLWHGWLRLLDWAEGYHLASHLPP